MARRVRPPTRCRPAVRLPGLLDVPVDEASRHALDPLQRRHRLDAVKRLLLRQSEAQPLVVVFEDLHWIDGETQALLDSLVESLPAARLVLVNYHPEYNHAWGGKTYCSAPARRSLPPRPRQALPARRQARADVRAPYHARPRCTASIAAG